MAVYKDPSQKGSKAWKKAMKYYFLKLLIKIGIISQTKGRVDLTDDTIFGAHIRTIFQRAPILGLSLCKYIPGTCLALYVINGKI